MVCGTSFRHEGQRVHQEAQNAELAKLRAEGDEGGQELDRLRDADLEQLRADRQRLVAELRVIQAKWVASEAAITKLVGSTSWKLTAPLRAADRLFRKR
jgi:hypothetical protein